MSLAYVHTGRTVVCAVFFTYDGCRGLEFIQTNETSSRSQMNMYERVICAASAGFALYFYESHLKDAANPDYSSLRIDCVVPLEDV